MSSIGTKTLNKIFVGNKEVQSIFIGNSKIYSNSSSLVVDPIFGNNSWATISQVSDIIASQNMNTSQIYTTYGWSVGDTKDITLSTNEVIEVQIIGFNHDTLSSDHTTKAGITLQMVNCLTTAYEMTSGNNQGGWNSSRMRISTLPTIKATLPSDLRSVLKLVDKKSANGGDVYYSEIVTSSDDLFLLAEIEIFGTVTKAQDGINEGTQYTYWASTSSRAKYYNNKGTLKLTKWWERSCSTDSSAYCMVTTGGSSSAQVSGMGGLRVAFAFCV